MNYHLPEMIQPFSSGLDRGEHNVLNYDGRHGETLSSLIWAQPWVKSRSSRRCRVPSGPWEDRVSTGCSGLWVVPGDQGVWTEWKIGAVPSICSLDSLFSVFTCIILLELRSLPPSPARALLIVQLEGWKFRTHLGSTKKNVNQSHSEKVIKISNVPEAFPSPEFSMQLSSHSLGASSSPQRLSKHLWHFRIKACTPGWLRWSNSSLLISCSDLVVCGGACCFGSKSPPTPYPTAHLCWHPHALRYLLCLRNADFSRRVATT